MKAPRFILLVEDNPMDVELTLRAFAKAGLSTPVEVARDGEEALRWVAAWQAGGPLPWVVLLDLKLPKVDGLDVLRHIKEQSSLRSVPVVVLTSSEEDRDVRDAYALGANAYVVKPASFDKLMHLVAQINAWWCVLNKAPDRP
jgi:CheY-like chemotaxis protein